MKKAVIIISIVILVIGLLAKLIYEYTLNIESSFLNNRNFYWFFTKEDADDIYTYQKDNKTLTLYGARSRTLTYEYDHPITIEEAVGLADDLCDQKFVPAGETKFYYTYTCNEPGKQLVVKKDLKIFWIEINQETPMFVYW